MLGLSGSELREASSLAESVRHGLEDLRSAPVEDIGLHRTASRFKRGVGISLEEAVKQLRRLESGIAENDLDAVSDANDLVDAIVDYLVVAIAMLDTPQQHGGGAKRRLEVLRRDAGRLAQYVCQMAEVQQP